MLEIDSLRIVFYNKAIAAAQNVRDTLGIAFPCRIGEEPFTPPVDGSIFGEFWFRCGKPYQMDLGAATAFECTPGILQFTVYGPEKAGDGPICKAGDVLKKAISRKQWAVDPDGYVTLETAGSGPLPGVKNGHKICIVDAAFDFHHRDPDATFS